MANETPSRPPPPFMANAILNFHFDYLNPSLINLYKIGYSLRMASDKVGKMQPQLLLNIKLEELALHLFSCSEFSWAKASSTEQ